MKTNPISFLAKLLCILNSSVIQQFLGQKISNSIFVNSEEIQPKLNDTNLIKEHYTYTDGFRDAYYLLGTNIVQSKKG